MNRRWRLAFAIALLSGVVVVPAAEAVGPKADAQHLPKFTGEAKPASPYALARSLREKLLDKTLGANQKYILKGLKADDEHHASVVAVGISGTYACSGVAIAPRMVLTAAHCFCQGKQHRPSWATGVNTGQLTKTGQHYALAAPKVVPFDDQSPCVHAPGRPDLTILVLAKPLPVDVARLPATPVVGTGGLVNVVGYGKRTADGDLARQRLHGFATVVTSDCNGIDAQRQPDSAIYDCHPPTAGMAEMVIGPEQWVGPDKIVVEAGSDACKGDSGGGAFWRLFDDEPDAKGKQLLEARYVLAGIVSRGAKSQTGCGSGSIHTLITPAVRRWIDKTAVTYGIAPVVATASP